MKKTRLLCLLTALTVCLALTPWAGQAEENEIYDEGDGIYSTVAAGWNWLFSYVENGARIEGLRYFPGAMDMVIPDTIAGLPVVESCGWLFMQIARNFSSIRFMDNLTYIPNWVCYRAVNVREVSIPPKVQHVGCYAFAGCTGIEEVYLPDTALRLEDGIFEGCENLKKIRMPAGLTRIPESFLSVCTSLEHVDIPAGVTAIGGWAFNYCTALTSLKLPAGVTYIGERAFGYSGLTSLEIPRGVEQIVYQTFMGCKNLRHVTIPDTVTRIDRSAFQDCTALTRLTIPASVTSIHADAFSGCDQLVLTVDEGSYAQQYAEENKIPYVLRGSEPALRGDVNGDGQVDIMDVIRLLKAVSGWQVEYDRDVADVTGDGTADIMDVIRLLKHVSGWSVTLE